MQPLSLCRGQEKDMATKVCKAHARRRCDKLLPTDCC